MNSYRSSVVSILNDDDNPSFTVSRAPVKQTTSSSSSSISSSTSLSSAPQYAAIRHPEPQPHILHLTNTHHGKPGSPIFNPMSFSDTTLSRIIPQQSIDYIYSHHDHQLPAQRPQVPNLSTEILPPRHVSLHKASQSTLSSPAPSLSEAADMKSSKVNKKNKYPCPFAQSHGCSATFTTSGHAARHGKKHTGEKGVSCPTCGKAFTRKDNMKQHIRTHRGAEAKKEMGARKSETESRRKRYSGMPAELGSLSPSDIDEQCLSYRNSAPCLAIAQDRYTGSYNQTIPPSCATTGYPYYYGGPADSAYPTGTNTLPGAPLRPQPRHFAGRLDTLASVAATTPYDANCYR
ncbi:C2H2 transcription factor (Egr2) [Ascosphaera apis ARSEF 7405]|uniref:C2H2 transcription factor (Egr2) n=1 Tax=Ascosphaera apis ARSEF 7405 TaxID=392613 RepID=A0A167ZKT0_9EURO|nr:C2H2 transcription factor (Egr2) [Ascosphaera apis ARSEF 7405]